MVMDCENCGGQKLSTMRDLCPACLREKRDNEHKEDDMKVWEVVRYNGQMAIEDPAGSATASIGLFQEWNHAYNCAVRQGPEYKEDPDGVYERCVTIRERKVE